MSTRFERNLAGWKDVGKKISKLERDNARLQEALKGTLYLFEAHAVSRTDLEQIKFARAELEAKR